MYTIILVFHAIFCILLVAVVLLQVGRGRGMLGFLGGGAAESLFGSRTGDVLTKSTTFIAILFMVTSLTLAYLSVKRGSSVMAGIGTGFKKAPVGTEPAPVGEDPLTQKTADVVDKVKQKVSNFIPRLTKETKTEPEGEKLIPTTTTKSKIKYDEKGNKIVDELKYDSQGNLIGHTQTTYDRLGKEIDKIELPLVEEEPGETKEPVLPNE